MILIAIACFLLGVVCATIFHWWLMGWMIDGAWRSGDE